MTRAQRRSSVDPEEIRRFSALAAEWWDPNGRLAPLHRLNPVRLAFIRGECVRHFGRSVTGLAPFAGLDLLDIGCGAGLLSEPAARLGFAVTGADASEHNIAAAEQHARASGLSIDYRCSTAEVLAEEQRQFDVVLAMEIIEHIVDIDDFLTDCAKLLRPGGLMFLATINRTLKSLALAKIGAEYILSWIPRGTHDWNRFVPPAKLKRTLESSGLAVTRITGVGFDPLSWDWRATSDTDVNYMVVAGHGVPPTGAAAGVAPAPG